MRHVDGIQLSKNSVEILRKISYDSYGELYENLEKQVESRGLDFSKAAKIMKVSRSTLLELKKAAEGKEFSLGFPSVWKIKNFIKNSKRGKRKIKGVMQYPGKCVPFI